MKRRALSTVVGAVFFVIIASSTFVYISYSMDIIDTFVQSIGVKQSLDVDRDNEEFEITRVVIVNNKFNLTIQNTGNIPINVTRLWVENKTDSSWTPSRYQINTAVSPQQTASNIGQNIALIALDTQAYDMKLVTERGNVKRFSVNSVGTQPLYMQLHAMPDTLPTEFASTLLLEVVNNTTNNVVLYNIKPYITENSAQTETLTVTPIIGPTPVPSEYESLAKGDTAYFKWSYKLKGNMNDVVTFTAGLVNGLPANTASASISISDIQFAVASGTSVKTDGLSCCKVPKTVLIFHNETDSTPNGEYQMYSADADTLGQTLQLKATGPIDTLTFITRNDSSVRTIDPGVWNVTLRYFNLPGLESLPITIDGTGKLQNMMVFHFDDTTGSKLADSSGNGNDLVLGSGNSAPTSVPNSGPHGSDTFYFDGDDDSSAPFSATNNDIGIDPESTAGWFRNSGGTATSTRTIYYVEGGQEYYKVVLEDSGNDHLLFQYKMGNSGDSVTTCESSTGFSDSDWHHFVVVRDNVKECKIYVDGAEVDYALRTFAQNTGGGVVDITDPTYIGSNDVGQDNFLGYLDDIMHWNNVALTAAQVLDLNNTNYGNASFNMGFKIMVVNQPATGVIARINQTTVGFNLPFMDPMGGTATYSHINYTFTNSTATTFQPNKRLLINMTFNSGLGVDFRIDDSTIESGIMSYVQVPGLDLTFPAFLVYNTGKQPTIDLQNTGPNGIWLIFSGTKIIFESLDGSGSYAGFLEKVEPIEDLTNNIYGMSPTKDSTFLESGQDFLLTFYHARTIPEIILDADIPPGLYNTFVDVVGYDEHGLNLFSTFDIGLVRVI